MVAEENDLKEQNYKVMGKWSKLAHVCWEGGNEPLKEFPGKWIRLCCDLAGCTVTTQLLTMWLSVAQIMLTQGRLHSDHTTTLLSAAQIMLINGRLHNDHTTTHNVAECGTDHVDAVHVRRG